MNEILFELLKAAIMAVVLVITRYVIPWVRERIGADKLEMAEKWVRYAVLKAQQVMCLIMERIARHTSLNF